MKSRLLLVEDHKDLGNVTKQYLQVMDFDVNWVTSGEEAFKAYHENSSQFDLLIIDIQLPGMSGFALAEKVIKVNEFVPFLFLTARNEKKERLYGLKIGAADYISKPFDIDELVLRIKNIIRRNPASETGYSELPGSIRVGDITLHKDSLKLNIDGSGEFSLTLREVELLEYLCENPSRVIKREEILLKLWGENDYFLGRSLDVFISRLRKILIPSKKTSIENVYGVGFIFKLVED
jgi:DNA-binding response OmpR family regulator